MGGRGANYNQTVVKDFYTHNGYSTENDSEVDSFLGLGNGGDTDKWLSSLTDKEKKTISKYALGDFKDINNAMEYENIMFNTSEYKKGKIIKSALDKAVLSKDIIVHRGDFGGLIPNVYGKDVNYILSNVKKGMTFTSPRFVSTSPNKPYENRLISYNIKVPRGNGRGAYIKTLSQEKQKENEYLINANTKYKITKVKRTKNSNDQVTIDLEII